MPLTLLEGTGPMPERWGCCHLGATTVSVILFNPLLMG